MLEKKKIQMDIDYIRLMNFSEEFIIPILRRKGFSSIDVVSGWPHSIVVICL